MLDNNLMFGVLHFLRPSEVALLQNLSVIVTAFLFRLMLKRMVSSVQWSALFSLMLGLMMSRMGEGSSISALNDGHMLLLLQVIFGAFGNIFTEKVLKGASTTSRGLSCAEAVPLSLQNMLLYVFGVVFNGVALVIVGAAQGRIKTLFGGWNAMCFAAVAINAFSVGACFYLSPIPCTHSCPASCMHRQL